MKSECRCFEFPLVCAVLCGLPGPPTFVPTKGAGSHHCHQSTANVNKDRAIRHGPTSRALHKSATCSKIAKVTGPSSPSTRMMTNLYNGHTPRRSEMYSTFAKRCSRDAQDYSHCAGPWKQNLSSNTLNSEGSTPCRDDAYFMKVSSHLRVLAR